MSYCKLLLSPFQFQEIFKVTEFSTLSSSSPHQSRTGEVINNETLRVVAQNKGLQARGLGKYFGQKRVVRNVSLGIRRGEAVGLLGPHGAGKTTTIRILSGVLVPTNGKVQINGIDIVQNPVESKKHVGYIPDRPYLYDKLTFHLPWPLYALYDLLFDLFIVLIIGFLP